PAALSGTVLPETMAPSSEKVALPVGTPPPGATGEKVAVTLMTCAGIGLAGLFDRLTLVDAWLTVCLKVGAVAGAYLLSPLKTASILCVPTDSGAPKKASGSNVALLLVTFVVYVIGPPSRVKVTVSVPGTVPAPGSGVM